MVPNSSFEQPDPADPFRPAYWFPRCEGAIWDNTTAYKGAYSLKSYSTCSWYIDITIPDPSYDYYLNIWHKAGFCPSPGRIIYKGYDKNGLVTIDSQQYVTCSSEWKHSSLNLPISTSYSVLNERTSHLHIELATAAPGSAFPDTSWWDGIILSQKIPGDANGDGKVDGIDYVIWLNHYGQSTVNGSADGDFDDSGVVDDADYQIWLENHTG
jgi:hypothetical protein